MRTGLALLVGALLGTGAVAQPTELWLVGGSLGLCSTLASRSCTGQPPTGRDQPRYRLDAESIAAALDPALWQGRPAALRAGLGTALAALTEVEAGRDWTASELSAAMAQHCTARDDVTRLEPCGTRAGPALWTLLTDAEQGAVLAALERAQTQGGRRLRERVDLDASPPAGAAILRAFVASAARRAGADRPRVAVVTASGMDPFDAVDYYLDAFEQAGAEALWWPVDAALAAAVFEQRDCAALPRLRRERLGLPGRERVYPDLVALQFDECQRQLAAPGLPEPLHGLFFSGGDQTRLLGAFVDSADRPNAWLEALRVAHARGRLVVGGTSAGAAVQAGLAMVSNGSNIDALRAGPLAAAAPEPGCEASQRCGPAARADRLTYRPQGGFGLLPGWTVDTHFSERAREWRLMALLAGSPATRGIGVDEATVAHVVGTEDGWRIEARGAGAVTLIERIGPASCNHGRRQAAGRIHRLVDGSALTVDATGVGPLELPARGQASAPARRGALLDAGVLSDRLAELALLAPARARSISAAELPARLRVSTDGRTEAAIAANGGIAYRGLHWRLEHGPLAACAEAGR